MLDAHHIWFFTWGGVLGNRMCWLICKCCIVHTCRALEELFEIVRLRRAEFQYWISVSYIEIYKDVLRDLLWEEIGVGAHELHIREDDQGSTG